MRLHIKSLEKTQNRGFSREIGRSEFMKLIVEWCVMCLAVAWLMYDELLLCWLFFPGVYWWIHFRREMLKENHKRKYSGQFAEGLTAWAAAVGSGYSAESAIPEALKDMRMIHGKDNEMMEEFERMAAQISLNQNIEELFFEMADRSGLEDAVSFADVFRAARRNGGNLSKIMEDTAELMQEKERVNQEIEILLAGKRYEQRIMCMIPLGMILYLRLGSPGYLDALYHSVAGACVMTVCLILYGAAVYMGSKVLKIEV